MGVTGSTPRWAMGTPRHAAQPEENTALLTNPKVKENTKEIRHHFKLNKNENMTYPNMGHTTKLVFREKFSIKCLYL